MSELYGTSQLPVDENAHDEELLELFLIDDVLRGTSDEIHNFCESEEAAILVEQGMLKKNALVRMNTLDTDYNRRLKLTCYRLAKVNNDPKFAKLVKFSKLKKQYANEIYSKYSKKAARLAKVEQKEYIKKARAAKATADAKSDK